jgi:uncharacterized protein YlaI
MVNKETKVVFDNEREVTLEVVECQWCNGALGIDASYLEQVQVEDRPVMCPYCRHNIADQFKE